MTNGILRLQTTRVVSTLEAKYGRYSWESEARHAMAQEMAQQIVGKWVTKEPRDADSESIELKVDVYVMDRESFWDVVNREAQSLVARLGHPGTGGYGKIPEE